MKVVSPARTSVRREVLDSAKRKVRSRKSGMETLTRRFAAPSPRGRGTPLWEGPLSHRERAAEGRVRVSYLRCHRFTHFARAKLAADILSRSFLIYTCRDGILDGARRFR